MKHSFKKIRNFFLWRNISEKSFVQLIIFTQILIYLRSLSNVTIGFPAKDYSNENTRKNIRQKIRSEYLSENLLWDKICETIFLENEGDSSQGGFNAKKPIVFALFNKPRPQKLHKEILWNISLEDPQFFWRRIWRNINHIYPNFDRSSQLFPYNHRISCNC